jgi:hypothetical protein
MSMSVGRLFCNLIIGIFITSLFIGIMDNAVPRILTCKYKESGICANNYVHIKFLNDNNLIKKDLQYNYCILKEVSSNIDCPAQLINCANQYANNNDNDNTSNNTLIKIRYATNLLFLWFVIQSTITLTKKINKITNNARIFFYLLLTVLIILSLVLTFRTLSQYVRICNCFVAKYNSDLHRVSAGFLGLAAMAIVNKTKNYEILAILYCVYGTSMFGI